jgi:hypothetical protein
MNLRYFKNLIPVAAVAFAVAGLSSCTKDLDVTPIDPSSTMTPSEPELFTKCYATMALSGNYGGDSNDCDIDRLDGGTTGFVRQMWNANELTTDEAICAWGDPGIPEFNYNNWGSSHPMLEGFYNRLYTSIAYCNHYLDVCNGIDATRTAEVRFLRAMYYYFLMDCFGNVPFATELMSTSPQQIQRADLFNWIESELLEVKDQMQTPVARTSKSDGYGRADQDAANLLLARLYLNAAVYTGSARWAEAKEYAEKVINGPHKLWTNGTNGWSAYQMLFMGDNGENGSSIEAVLPLLGDGLNTTSYGSAMFLMCSAWKDDMDVDGDFGLVGKFWAGNRARRQLVEKFFPNGDAPNVTIREMAIVAGDARALFFGVDRTLSANTPSEFATGFSVGKYRNTYSTGATPRSTAFPDADYFLMRSAEAYLIAAEADARQNNGTTTATGAQYINALRSRAGTTTVSSYTLKQILDERSRELYWEGFRRTDLIRYGIYAGDNSGGENAWEWKGGSENGASLPAYRNLFAIPSSDLTANPNLKQNEGY